LDNNVDTTPVIGGTFSSNHRMNFIFRRSLHVVSKTRIKEKKSIDYPKQISDLMLSNKKDDAFLLFNANYKKCHTLDLVSGKYFVELYTQLNVPDMCIDIIDKIVAGRTKPTVEIINSLISFFMRSNQVPRAEKMLSLLVECRIDPTLGTYHALLDGYLVHNLLEKAEAIIKTMREEKLDVGIHFYESILEKAVRLESNQVLRIFGEMQFKGQDVTQKMLECLLNHHLNTSDFEMAGKIFQKMKTNKNVISYTICEAIMSKIAPKDIKLALQWLRKFENSNVDLTWHVYVPLISIYSHESKGHSIEKLISRMLENNVIPDVSFYNILFQLYSHNFEKIKQIWSEIKTNRIPLTIKTKSLLRRVYGELGDDGDLETLEVDIKRHEQ
jgi:pentatricopeptide repeat protein